MFLEVERGGFVQVEQLAAEAGFTGLFRRGEFALGESDATLLGDDANGFREGERLHLHDEGEDVAGRLAAEAVEERWWTADDVCWQQAHSCTNKVAIVEN